MERCGKPDSPAELDLKQCYGLTRTATGNVRQWVFEQGDERYELEPQSNLVVNSTVTLIQSALQGVGFIYVPRILVTDHLASGKLVQCLGDWQTAVLKLFLVYPKTRFTAPKVREFVKYLTEFESHLQ
ncbi:MAG: LysR substrate-binding domain-containing protein [Pseudomonadota bacterium]